MHKKGYSLLTFWTIITAFSTVCSGSILEKYIEYCGIGNCTHDLCVKHDQNQTSSDNNQIIDDTCCGECSCDTGCFKRGDCCPDIFLSSESQYPPGGVYVCMDTLNIASNSSNATRKYYTVIGRCPTTYKDSNVARKCQLLSDEEDDKVHVPVFDSITEELFRNIYCALCNSENVALMKPWKLISRCETDEDIFATKPNNCTNHIEEWVPPSQWSQEVCIPLYDQCNVTGLWEEYDEEIVSACDSYKAIFQERYQNIFCYVCNIKVVTSINTDLKSGKETLPPLSILFQFQEGVQRIGNQLLHSSCLDGFVYDQFKDVCRQIVCLDGFTLDNDTTDCIPEGSLCAQTVINFVHEGMTEMFDNEVKCSLENFLKQTVALNVEWKSEHTRFADDESFNTNTIYPVQGTCQYEASLVDSLLEYQDRVVSISSQWHDGSTVTYNFTVLIDVDSEFIYVSTTELECEQLNSDHIDAVQNESSNQQQIICNEHRYVRVSHLIHCPVIALNMTDFNVTETADGLNLSDVGLYLKRYQYAKNSSNGDVIYVCAKDYIVSAKHMIDETVSEVDIIVSYLTIVCSTVSLVCSMFTFITYAYFPALRSQPGINNMVLCIVVFLGHLLFVIGINQNGLETLCIAIGVALHFLWLFIVVWMSVCCFHMFRVFRSLLTIPRNESKVRTTVIYIVVACFLSLLPVLANIIYSLTVTGGKQTGYGPKLCWISHPTLAGYTMSLPALLLVTINICLFSFVIFSIRQLPEVQSTVQNRQYMTMYLKLSTLTGAIWLTVIPTVFTDFKVFDYIFTILFANQGLFIMLAFICNKKTVSLYKQSWHKSDKYDQGRQNATNLTNINVAEENNTR